MQVQSRINTVAERNRNVESKKRAKIVKLPHDDYYFYPFLQCPICGSRITASHSKGRNQRYAYYHCNKCRKYRIPAQKMNEDILHYISKIRPCKAVLDLYEEVLGDIRTEKFRGINKEKSRIQEDIKKIEARLERLQDRFLDGEIGSDDYREIRQRYNNEIHALQCQIEIMKTPNRTAVEPRVAYAMSFINNMVKCLSDVEMSVKMDVLGSIFSGKMVFVDGKCRTAEFNPVISLMIGKSSICEDENKSGVLDFSKTPLQYPEPGSNRHGSLHWCLRPTRLPIPPSGRLQGKTEPSVEPFRIRSANIATFISHIQIFEEFFTFSGIFSTFKTDSTPKIAPEDELKVEKLVIFAVNQPPKL